MIAEATFGFLRKLAANNDRQWFADNKAEYEKARANFLEFCEKILDEMKEFEPEVYDTQAKDCIFRIYRDVRFSKNKAPYKTHLSAAFGKGGRKSGRTDYYFHLQNGDSFLGGGMWNPTREELAAFREEIDYSPQDIKAIIEDPVFKKLFPYIHGDKLVRSPKGYPEDHPDIELLRYKELFFMKVYSNEEVLSAGFVEQLIADMKVLKPFLDYLNRLFYEEI